MSLGVNTVFKLAAAAAKILGEAGYDIEIVEKHHNKKMDAPSGTALAIADAINEAMDHRYTYKLDRSAERAKREANEIGIQAVRGGTIVR
ncbi:MAG: dihydrodipicolinate reductase C-terminal domain-containing protein [Coprococcus sp.]